MTDELTNSGHGHVTPRRDGIKARCGGPAMCRVCQQEQAAKGAAAELKCMTPSRAAFFLERFKREEKMLGPNEQAALDFAIAALTAAQQAQEVAAVNTREQTFQNGYRIGYQAGRASLPTQPAAQAAPEPVGEPFAWTSMGQIRFTPPTQDHDTYTPLYTHPAPGVPDDVQHEIAAALALFPINITGQSFVVSGFNDGKLLEADGDTFFFSQQKVIALLEKLHTHLAAAQAKGADHG